MVQLIQQRLKAVKKFKATLVFFDGDADRIIMCDENGKIINGDQIIAMLALRWKTKNILKVECRYFNVKLWIRKYLKNQK